MATPLIRLGNVSVRGINYTAAVPPCRRIDRSHFAISCALPNMVAQILAVTEDREAATAIGINASRV